MLNHTQRNMEELASELLSKYMALGPIKTSLVRLNDNSLDKLDEWSEVPSSGNWLKFRQILKNSPNTFGLGLKINDHMAMGIVAKIDYANNRIEVNAIDFNHEAFDITTFILAFNSILYLLDIGKIRHLPESAYVLIKNEGCSELIKDLCKSVGYTPVLGGIKK